MKDQKTITEIINEKRAKGEKIDWKEIKKLNKARSIERKIIWNMNRPK